ncbi:MULTISPECIES: putative entry exclusion protein TrbK-alt [unclassified Mesorhizobium]|uniref:putative entry exclusion protein TrbK-alt n=1 Tax=unclassified Mesorhizobium TaxID=325217 RepID=UPI00120748AE|nr:MULTISPECIES: putative entry exclusion protein TrbK-alt [unclassified Mesorhizobium]MDG4887843.1 putative entry exclusion protein TrbK-alt [Mesorhizobium sp. WSM4887]TIQ07666.1 MAG: conjugal transfer protein TrbK [Mesorhizobium sp.]TJW02122.1 MAG: conjugal transfer protein TrbK [Mesorhizobium sp.]
MDGKTLVRITAPIFVAIAVTATAVEMTRKEDKSGSAVLEAPGTSRSPLREGFRHCQVLGEAALRDSGCLRLWAEQRDRFLGSKAPFASPASEPVTAPSPDATTQGAQ